MDATDNSIIKCNKDLIDLENKYTPIFNELNGRVVTNQSKLIELERIVMEQQHKLTNLLDHDIIKLKLDV